jgi:hypothetical protein
MQGARQAAAELFAKKVKEYTQGRYEVRVFCCSQLGNDPKNIEQLALGGIDFTVSSTGSYAPHVETLNLTMLPFLVDNYEQGWKLYDTSKWLKKQFDKAPAKGFRFLSTFEAGFRCMTTKDPLRTPEDAKGKKLRTFPNEMQRWTLEAVGFTVQIMPLPEVYLAIQQGTVSGQENPIDTITPTSFTRWRLREAAKPSTSRSPGDLRERPGRALCGDKRPLRRRERSGGLSRKSSWPPRTSNQGNDGQGAKVTSPSLEPFLVAVHPSTPRRARSTAMPTWRVPGYAEAVRKAPAKAPAKRPRRRSTPQSGSDARRRPRKGPARFGRRSMPCCPPAPGPGAHSAFSRPSSPSVVLIAPPWSPRHRHVSSTSFTRHRLDDRVLSSS